MQYRNLGNTGLKVSPLCLGCMTFGAPDRGDHPWTLPEPQSRPLIRKAIEMGINFFDTANAYSDGTSEEIVGQALKDYARRDEVVIATKVFLPMSKGPNGGGLSRKAIFTAIDASLRRLGTDYVDLYQIHRWDPATPIEETLEALHDLVKAGKARYLGASSMYAWQFAQGPASRPRESLDALREHAEFLQPPLPRRGARNAAAVRRCSASPFCRGARSPAGGSHASGRPRRRVLKPTNTATRCLSASDGFGSQGRRSASQPSPPRAGCPARKWPSRG